MRYNNMETPAENYEIGIIAEGRKGSKGYKSTIKGDDDGKVGVYSTHLAHEQDHIVLPFSHYKLIRRKETAQQIIHFLKTGLFHKQLISQGSSPTNTAPDQKGD